MNRAFAFFISFFVFKSTGYGSEFSREVNRSSCIRDEILKINKKKYFNDLKKILTNHQKTPNISLTRSKILQNLPTLHVPYSSADLDSLKIFFAQESNISKDWTNTFLSLFSHDSRYDKEIAIGDTTLSQRRYNLSYPYRRTDLHIGRNVIETWMENIFIFQLEIIRGRCIKDPSAIRNDIVAKNDLILLGSQRELLKLFDYQFEASTSTWYPHFWFFDNVTKNWTPVGWIYDSLGESLKPLKGVRSSEWQAPGWVLSTDGRFSR